MVRLLKDNRGFALILTILITSLLVFLTLQFNISMRSDLFGAARLRKGTMLSYVARSGFESALALLYQDAQDTEYDSLDEEWANSRVLSEYSGEMFEQGRFEVQINDQSGKIQINALVDKNGKVDSRQQDVLTRFLGSEVFGLDPEEVGNLIDAITDWMDPDNEVTRFGAEDSYYRSLPQPYPCKNGPLEVLEELLLVRGMTRTLFYGGEQRPGLSDYLTVYGNGEVNINTAPPLVLKALSEQIEPYMVQSMVQYRKEEPDKLADPKWYKQVTGMDNVSIEPEIITTKSTTFEILSKGLEAPMTVEIAAVVERKEKSLKLLSWKTQ